MPRNDNVFHFTNLQTAAETQNAVLRSILEKDRKDCRPSATNAMIWSCEMHHLPKTCCLHNPQCVSVTDLGECDGRSNGDHIATEKKTTDANQSREECLLYIILPEVRSSRSTHYRPARVNASNNVKHLEESGSENGDVINLLPFSPSQSQLEESDRLRRSEGSPLTHLSNINKNRTFWEWHLESLMELLPIITAGKAKIKHRPYDCSGMGIRSHYLERFRWMPGVCSFM